MKKPEPLTINFLEKILRYDQGLVNVPGKGSVPGQEPGPMDFARSFLRLNGAVVEDNRLGLEALLPRDLQEYLDVSEYVRILGGHTGLEGDVARHVVSYGTPLLDRMLSRTMGKIPLVSCSLYFDYIKSGGFQRLLDEQLSFYTAVASIETIADTRVDYAVVACHYTAQSDEQKEGLLSMTLNMETGAFVPDMARLLDDADCRVEYHDPDQDKQKRLAALGDNIDVLARSMLSKQLEPFRMSMNRRFKRDVNNLIEYYGSLELEMKKSLDNTALSEKARQERKAKIYALPEELSTKAHDLLKKYSINIRLKPAAVMLVRTPARKIICKALIGRTPRQLSLIYNPVTRSIDPLACARCRQFIFHVHFDDTLQPCCVKCVRR